MSSLPQKAEKKQRPRLRLDAASRALLHRFMMDWVWPRRLELIWTLFLTVCLAGVTGSYPAIIKKSFDLLMGGHKGALPWVLAAIVGITLARATLLFLQAVASSRVVLRLTSDMQKAAFQASHQFGFLTPFARDAGTADVPPDERHWIYSGRVDRRAEFVPARSLFSNRTRRRDALPRLGDDTHRPRRISARCDSGRDHQRQAPPRCKTHAERPWRHDIAAV